MTTETADGKVCFQIHCPGARQVSLAGDFNGWNVHTIPMRREGAGSWVCSLHLPPGSYQFRYFADGEWVVDYAAFGLEPGPFGWNSVVLIKPPLAA